jgi:hypothetical protein
MLVQHDEARCAGVQPEPSPSGTGIAFWRFPPVHKLAIKVVFGSRAVVAQKLAIDSKVKIL